MRTRDPLGLHQLHPGGPQGHGGRHAGAFRGQRPAQRSGRPEAAFAARAITEPHAGSEMPSAPRTTAVREGEQWVLNGEKIFVTAGRKALVDSPGFVVVWATVDPGAGRGGGKAFVVEAGA